VRPGLERLRDLCASGGVERLYVHSPDRLPQRRGEACLLRSADEYICAFECQEEAERFYAALGLRLEKCGFTLAAEKPPILPFRRQPPTGQGSFAVLGLEFRWGWDRAGKAHLQRCTARPKLRASLPRLPSGARRIAIDGSACC
jgi:hypothetical protein